MEAVPAGDLGSLVAARRDARAGRGRRARAGRRRSPRRGPRRLGDDDAPPSVWLRGGIGVDRPTPAHLRLLSGGEVGLLKALQRSQELQAHLAALAPPAAGTLVHGDLRWENVLVAPGARAASRVARRLGDGRLRGTGVGRRLLRGVGRQRVAVLDPRRPGRRAGPAGGRGGAADGRDPCPDWTPSGRRIAPPVLARRPTPGRCGARSSPPRGSCTWPSIAALDEADLHPWPSPTCRSRSHILADPAPRRPRAPGDRVSHDDPAAGGGGHPPRARGRRGPVARRASRGWETPRTSPSMSSAWPAGGGSRRALVEAIRGEAVRLLLHAGRAPARRRPRRRRAPGGAPSMSHDLAAANAGRAAWSRGGASSGRRTGAGSSSGAVCGSG